MYLRTCILGVMNQTYKNYIHSVNITIDDTFKTFDYNNLYDDLINDRLIINHNQNNHTHANAMNAIMAVPDYLDYDIFIKMDDDDIYKKEYVETIVDCFNETGCDTCTSKINTQLNGISVHVNSYNNLGNSQETEIYKMPMTYSFNKKALELICKLSPYMAYDDMMWRDTWVKANLKHIQVNNDDNVIWHVHGKNVSTANFLIK